MTRASIAWRFVKDSVWFLSLNDGIHYEVNGLLMTTEFSQLVSNLVYYCLLHEGCITQVNSLQLLYKTIPMHMDSQLIVTVRRDLPWTI